MAFKSGRTTFFKWPPIWVIAAHIVFKFIRYLYVSHYHNHYLGGSRESGQRRGHRWNNNNNKKEISVVSLAPGSKPDFSLSRQSLLTFH